MNSYFAQHGFRWISANPYSPLSYLVAEFQWNTTSTSKLGTGHKAADIWHKYTEEMKVCLFYEIKAFGCNLLSRVVQFKYIMYTNYQFWAVCL